MRKHFKLLLPTIATVGLLALLAAVPGPPSTDYTRGLLRTTNATEARTYLGVSAGGGGTNSLTVKGTNVSNANIASGADVDWDIVTATNAVAKLTALSFNAITFSSGTNLNAMDCSLGNSQFAYYKLSLTNNAYFTTPTSVPTTPKTFTVVFQQDSTGTRTVTWTNGFYKWPGGPSGAFQPDTNANAVSWVNFTIMPFTNSVLMGDYGVLDNR